MKTFDLSDKDLQIGDVFTPLIWGEFAIDKFNIFSKWLNGASVFDPTMGEGNLLEALITFGLAKGHRLDTLPTNRLYGNELNTYYFNQALNKFREKYGLDMSQNFTNEDVLRLNPTKHDIVFGNPPWQNFVDLPESYKEQIKSYFFKFDLIGNSQNLLLGGSRIDIAALIIQIAIKDFLKPNGEAIIFMPLSLFLNDGANRSFRTYSIGEVKYCVDTVFDFNDEDVFGGIATRYGLSHFIRDKNPVFPIPYFRNENGTWNKYDAKPMFHATDPLSIISNEEGGNFDNIKPVLLKKESSPRQGINTCGANDVYFFDFINEVNEDLVCVSNKTKENIILPKKFVFPLITSKEFKGEIPPPSKWVLLPYNKNGKPLEWKQIQQFPELSMYLESNKDILQGRKGVMLNAILKRGHWWAMLGVGEYNFFPHKIVWEAYGKTSFNPTIFEGNWQANQSLQAFIPVKTLPEAQRIQMELSDKQIENYLLSLKMEGTMNWAQPGKIKKLIKYEEETLTLF
ncbi:MAG: SAM-dependent DNA methyltransferase [Bacteroidetes bacterium]|nr:SAM-dependent DNA methyltransferase [Bacteroidota bacterium]MBU1720320.1 SAM-dependent DNA methyltransferase [Bacteroidota bacterium]